MARSEHLGVYCCPCFWWPNSFFGGMAVIVGKRLFRLAKDMFRAKSRGARDRLVVCYMALLITKVSCSFPALDSVRALHRHRGLLGGQECANFAQNPHGPHVAAMRCC